MRALFFLLALFSSSAVLAQEERLFAGTINEKLKITMYLEGLESGTYADALSGAYKYEDKEGFLLLNGYVNKEGAVCLTEFATPNFSGVFLGRLAQKHIEGTWISADQKMQYPFQLMQVPAVPAEIARFKKGRKAIVQEFQSY